ncbi:MAG: adenosylcobalamin-dependent ribonucleoside-diphosphate reductase, partial [Candidatus Rokubacteria bacterium]|nr:adenosylcobalamin-dependent ribonucleoside-diphosphate reductase [Candidatus Rokubacteria bacterium]
AETPAELFARVARAVAEAELRLGTAKQAATWQERFEGLMTSLAFLPSSPVLMNAGTALGQLSACFVLPIEDSLESIFDTLRAMALVQRGGGGAGFSFSRLRPRGDLIASVGGAASGPVSFMRVYDAATQNVKLGGRRRGANMGVLRVDHPDILEFIDAKLDGALPNFNLSVAVTDAFLGAVERRDAYDVVHPERREPVGRLDARGVFDRIVDRAWRVGDPGLLYLDAINRANPTPARGDIEATNPCGEVPLLPWESCVLGSVNLAAMVSDGGGRAAIDWDRLGDTVRTGVRFLDDVVEINRDPLPEIAARSRESRKIGLGVMGFAECLIRLGVPYDSDEAVAWAERLAASIAAEARAASRALAEARGVFPGWRRSVHAANGLRLRNATLLSVAPTGTISILAGTTGSIEPLFALAYRREHTLGGAPLVEVNPVFLRSLRARRADAAALLDAVLTTGRLRGIPDVPEDLARLFATATEIPARRHLAIQAAFQRHVDNAVAKTINLPPETHAEDVAGVMLEGWRLGLKGLTVYRSGTKPGQVLTLGIGDDATARELFAKCDPDACRL